MRPCRIAQIRLSHTGDRPAQDDPPLPCLFYILYNMAKTVARSIRLPADQFKPRSVEFLIQIADYYKTSVDYLLGLTENPHRQ